MPKRKPLARLLTEGAHLKNPGRFRGRRGPSGARPVGDPYVHMTEVERRYWRELASSCPWITSRHRVLLFMTCRLLARVESGEAQGLTAMRTLTSLLAKLGATPVDEGKVSQAGDDDAQDPGESFFGAGGRTQ